MAPIRSERDGSVAILVLDRPDVFNCLSLEAFAAIEACFDDWEKDGAVRSVLIAAEGKHFCTGADLGEVTTASQTEAGLADFLARGHRALARMEASPLPVVATVQGLCLAGGLELMLACDLCIAGRGARFGDQHARFGLVPGWGSSQRLPRTIGLRRALDLMLSARWIDATTAEGWGLVNQVVEDGELRAAGLKLCHELGERSRDGLAAIKRLAREGLEGSLADGLALERRLAPPVLRSADAREGLDAFANKRQPAFGAGG